MNKAALALVLIPTMVLMGNTKGCRPEVPEAETSAAAKTIPDEMNKAYYSLYQLYGYIWSDNDLLEPQTNKQLSEIIANLTDNFHDIDKLSPVLKKEPGFRAALLSNIELLGEVKAHLRYGSSDFLKQQLRKTTANCMSCHTRMGSQDSKLRLPPFSFEESPAAQLAFGDFLISTRQFKSANEYFLVLMDHFLEKKTIPAFEKALKRYLLVATRVEELYPSAAKNVKRMLKSHILPKELRKNMLIWTEDLSNFSYPGPAFGMRQFASLLTAQLEVNNLVQVDEGQLIRTLLATSILHRELSLPLKKEDRAKSLLMLAKAYLHLPIDIFDNMPAILLAQCIRENPHTPEARGAFELLQANLIQLSSDKVYLNTGSGAIHNIPEGSKRIKELRKLAFTE